MVTKAVAQNNVDAQEALDELNSVEESEEHVEESEEEEGDWL